MARADTPAHNVQPVSQVPTKPLTGMLKSFVPHLRGPGTMRTNWPYECARTIFREHFWLFHAVRYRCLKNVPQTGPVIFAPNHVSYFDPPLIGSGTPYRTRFMAWDQLFRVPLLGPVITKLGAYPVKLKSADKGAIERTLKILRNGEALVIFPEGARAYSSDLQPFEKGVARVALQTGTPIVPVTITGAFDAWPRTRTFPRPFHGILVKFHPAIDVTKVEPELPIKVRCDHVNRLIETPLRRRLRAFEKVKRLKQR